MKCRIHYQLVATAREVRSALGFRGAGDASVETHGEWVTAADWRARLWDAPFGRSETSTWILSTEEGSDLVAGERAGEWVANIGSRGNGQFPAQTPGAGGWVTTRALGCQAAMSMPAEPEMIR